MNPPLIVAGCLALLGAAIHGVGGEILVLQRLSPEVLPPTGLGGPRTTRVVLHITWHLTTVAFVGATRSARSLVRHPAPALFTAIAALAWWGVL